MFGPKTWKIQFNWKIGLKWRDYEKQVNDAWRMNSQDSFPLKIRTFQEVHCGFHWFFNGLLIFVWQVEFVMESVQNGYEKSEAIVGVSIKELSNSKALVVSKPKLGKWLLKERVFSKHWKNWRSWWVAETWLCISRWRGLQAPNWGSGSLKSRWNTRLRPYLKGNTSRVEEYGASFEELLSFKAISSQNEENKMERMVYPH